MILIWGSRMYGKVDHVPGLDFHIATKFGHLWYIPLIPTKSYFVLAEDGDQFRGIDLGLNAKSILIAWLRAGTLVGGIIAAIALLAMLGDKHDSEFNPLLLALSIASFAIFAWTKVFTPITRCSYERACDLCRRIGLSAEGWMMLAQAYGQPVPADVQAAMAGSAAAPPPPLPLQ